jgi:hypothetical protein
MHVNVTTKSPTFYKAGGMAQCVKCLLSKGLLGNRKALVQTPVLSKKFFKALL